MHPHCVVSTETLSTYVTRTETLSTDVTVTETVVFPDLFARTGKFSTDITVTRIFKDVDRVSYAVGHVIIWEFGG